MNDVINLLRNCNVENQSVSERRLRAVMIARAFAYSAPINLEESFDDNLASQVSRVTNIVQDINETLLLDLKLTIDIFKSLYKARYEVASSVCDPTLIEFVLSSMTQKEMLNKDSANALSSTLHNPDCSRTTLEIFKHFNDFLGDE